MALAVCRLYGDVVHTLGIARHVNALRVGCGVLVDVQQLTIGGVNGDKTHGRTIGACCHVRLDAIMFT